MRLGAYVAELEPGSQVAERLRRARSSPSATATATSSTRVTAAASRAAGFVCSGTSPDGRLVEFIELRGPPVLGRHPGPPRVQEPPRAPGAAVPGVRRGRAGPGRGPQPAPARPRRRAPGSPARRSTPGRDAPAARDASGFRHLERATSSTRATSSRWPSGTFEAPDGSTFEREIVHHPGAVSVVPLHDDGTVTLVRQYRAALDGDLLEIPAGKRDVAGEPPELHRRRASWSRRSACGPAGWSCWPSSSTPPGSATSTRGSSSAPSLPTWPPTCRASRSST